MVTSAIAQTKEKADQEKSYTQAINSRADKIVATLGIHDSVKYSRVKNLITNHYRNLNTIYSLRDTQIKVARMQLSNDNDGLKKTILKIQERSDSDVAALHPKFLLELSKELSSKQIDQVKDGLTYNVLNVTFNGYTQMILNLTEEQKKQIMTWLIEAREHAMDAESSEKKHAWFGKYKGRINNYLSAAGYDLKKEGEE